MANIIEREFPSYGITSSAVCWCREKLISKCHSISCIIFVDAVCAIGLSTLPRQKDQLLLQYMHIIRLEYDCAGSVIHNLSIKITMRRISNIWRIWKTIRFFVCILCKLCVRACRAGRFALYTCVWFVLGLIRFRNNIKNVR